MRQHPQEKNDLVRNRDGIILTIQTSPGGSDLSKIRGFTCMSVTDSFTASCKYKGYYGFSDDGAQLANLVSDPDGEDDEHCKDTAVQLDGMDKDTRGNLLAPDESNWPGKSQRW